MTRLPTVAAVVAVCLFAAGCLPLSLEPLYTGEGDVVFDQALVGRWKNETDQKPWEIAPIEGEDAYIVRNLDGPPTTQFRGVLVQLGERRFLDLTPTGHEPDIDPAFGVHVIAGHTIWRVTVHADRLRFALPDIDRTVELLQDKPEAIRHQIKPAVGEFDKPDVVFTDTTANLQAFVRDQLTDEFFTNEIVLLPLDPAEAPAEPADAPAPARSDQP